MNKHFARFTLLFPAVIGNELARMYEQGPVEYWTGLLLRIKTQIRWVYIEKAHCYAYDRGWTKKTPVSRQPDELDLW